MRRIVRSEIALGRIRETIGGRGAVRLLRWIPGLRLRIPRVCHIWTVEYSRWRRRRRRKNGVQARPVVLWMINHHLGAVETVIVIDCVSLGFVKSGLVAVSSWLDSLRFHGGMAVMAALT